jgi:hypothetical protein
LDSFAILNSAAIFDSAALDFYAWQHFFTYFLHIISPYLANLLNRVLVKSFTMSFRETGEFFRVDSGRFTPVRVEIKKKLCVLI